MEGRGGEDRGILDTPQSWIARQPQLTLLNRAGLIDNKIAVVCSARSTGKKVEGTTSR